MRRSWFRFLCELEERCCTIDGQGGEAQAPDQGWSAVEIEGAGRDGPGDSRGGAEDGAAIVERAEADCRDAASALETAGALAEALAGKAERGASDGDPSAGRSVGLGS